MRTENNTSAFLLGLFIFLGLLSVGYLLSGAVVKVKEYERSVTVKGLSEREYDADIVIWPILFTAASNDLGDLYSNIEKNTKEIKDFLKSKGIDQAEITVSIPAITDKLARQFGDTERAEFRYTAVQTVTVYSKNINLIREAMNSLSELGKNGIAFSGEDYQAKTEYLFTRLNSVKPEMIEEATRNAREVAGKFASDSNSTLGKIKTASQGQFSIEDRDKNNPHIKKVRVVSTVEYYLSD
ncbi:SIMPL domain-containing protein [Methylomonas sp. MgM2]